MQIHLFTQLSQGEASVDANGLKGPELRARDTKLFGHFLRVILDGLGDPAERLHRFRNSDPASGLFGHLCPMIYFVYKYFLYKITNSFESVKKKINSGKN